MYVYTGGIAGGCASADGGERAVIAGDPLLSTVA